MLALSGVELTSIAVPVVLVGSGVVRVGFVVIGRWLPVVVGVVTGVVAVLWVVLEVVACRGRDSWRGESLVFEEGSRGVVGVVGIDGGIGIGRPSRLCGNSKDLRDAQQRNEGEKGEHAYLHDDCARPPRWGGKK